MSNVELRNFVKAAGMVGLTVDQYHRMIEGGILPEGGAIELLDGFLVHKDRGKHGEDPMSIGKEHTWVVQKLMRLLREVERYGCHVRIQQPLAILPDSEPEPDAVIAFGTEDDYLARVPTGADVSCVIEVADSSLQRDSVTKLRIYADAGIEQYVIVDLIDRVVNLHESPVPGQGRYERPARLGLPQEISFNCGRGNSITMPVKNLIPK